MSSKIFFYGDILGLYIDGKLSKANKTDLSREMKYSRASGLRSFLFRNQESIIDKKMINAIDNVFGFNYYITVLDDYKKQLMKKANYKEVDCSNIRIFVKKIKNHYDIRLIDRQTEQPLHKK